MILLCLLLRFFPSAKAKKIISFNDFDNSDEQIFVYYYSLRQCPTQKKKKRLTKMRRSKMNQKKNTSLETTRQLQVS